MSNIAKIEQSIQEFKCGDLVVKTSTNDNSIYWIRGFNRSKILVKNSKGVMHFQCKSNLRKASKAERKAMQRILNNVKFQVRKHIDCNDLLNKNISNTCFDLSGTESRFLKSALEARGEI